jgi:hypothetical protein
MSATAHNPIVTAAFEKSYPKLISQGYTILSSMGASLALYTTAPSPTLASILTLLQALETQQAITAGKAKGTAELRNLKAKAYKSAVKLLVAWIQSQCDANPAEAMAMITASGFKAKAVGKHDKPVFEAKLGKATTEVTLWAKAGPKGCFYDWRYSLDGKTWISVQSTNDANTMIPGLPVLATVSFQYRYTHKNTPTAWSQIVTILVQ